jgi:hypothetical protein
MEVHQALRAAMEQAGWNPTQLASVANVREGSVYKWLRGAAPGGLTLVLLMHKLPGFAERLGFSETKRAA